MGSSQGKRSREGCRGVPELEGKPEGIGEEREEKKEWNEEPNVSERLRGPFQVQKVKN